MRARTVLRTGDWPFKVGTKNIAFETDTADQTASGQTFDPKFDLNTDKRIDIVDFSILAYWYGRSKPAASADLNHDGVVNLIDFSILAYHWTG